jgi:hypothetical protein
MFVEGGLVWNEDKAEKKQAGVGKYNVRASPMEKLNG